jgi:rSAM/selenodomain-associated transferase 1
MKRSLIVMGKAPEAGRTKTRLSPPLTPEEAAGLYEAFLIDCVDLGFQLGWERVSVVYPPTAGARTILRQVLPRGTRLIAQHGSGLQAALSGAFEREISRGFDRVVLIGSDNPSLPTAIIEDAAIRLGDYDLVIGPSMDGGYYLIAMSYPHPGLFERITWSTSVVYAETLERASELGLRVFALPAWYDVDTVQELCRLRVELERLPLETAPQTRLWMDKFRAIGDMGASAGAASAGVARRDGDEPSCASCASCGTD